MPQPLSQALKYVHRIHERNELQVKKNLASLKNEQVVDGCKIGSRYGLSEIMKGEIQPDYEYLFGLFDKMKEQFQKEIQERRAYLASMGYNSNAGSLSPEEANPSIVNSAQVDSSHAKSVSKSQISSLDGK